MNLENSSSLLNSSIFWCTKHLHLTPSLSKYILPVFANMQASQCLILSLTIFNTAHVSLLSLSSILFFALLAGDLALLLLQFVAVYFFTSIFIFNKISQFHFGIVCLSSKKLQQSTLKFLILSIKIFQYSTHANQ